MLVEIPLLIVSGLFFAVCLSSPKTGRVLAVVLLVATIFVMGVAGEAGYMDSGGMVMSFSLVIDIAGIAIATRKLDSEKELPVDSSEEE